MDYSLDCMTSDTNSFVGESYKEAAEEILLLAKKYGLVINQTHAPFSFRDIKKEGFVENVLFPRTVRAIEISAMLGAKVVVIHPSPLYL